MPEIDRSICAALGVAKLKKNPIGLRGKYWPDYSPFGGTVGRPKLAKRAPLPALPRARGNRFIVPDPPQKTLDRRPIMHRWSIEIQPTFERCWRPPWPMRDLPWTLFPLRPAAYFAISRVITMRSNISWELGFTLVDGYPVSTYVPYKRVKPTIEDPNDEQPKEQPEDVKVPAHQKIAKVVHEEVWAPYLEQTTTESADVEEVPAGLSSDMGTRYYWQPSYSPDRFRKSKKVRAGRWTAWARHLFGPLGLPLSKRAPWIAQGIGRATWHRNRDAFVERMRQLRRKGRSSRL